MLRGVQEKKEQKETFRAEERKVVTGTMERNKKRAKKLENFMLNVVQRILFAQFVA